MTRTLIAAATLSLLLPACAGKTTAPEAAAPTEARAKHSAVDHDAADTVSVQHVDTRSVGDVLVHRFSGSSLDAPLVLTEAVVGQEGHSLVVEYTLETGTTKEQLRVLRHARTFEVESVARLVDGEEVPATFADFDALLEKTVVAPDLNEGKLSESNETCLVGEAEVECTSTRFHVVLGGKAATLTVTSSDDLPGRDLGGVLETEQGDVLYRAELIELQRGARGVARNDR